MVEDFGDKQALLAETVIEPTALLLTVAVVLLPLVGDTLRLPVLDQVKLVALVAVADKVAELPTQPKLPLVVLILDVPTCGRSTFNLNTCIKLPSLRRYSTFI